MAGTTSGFMRPPVFDLQAHLFASLLQGHTADVSLVVRGSWEAVYMLHRVVLIQAGFFHSLFQSSGFSETRRNFRDRDEIEIAFDDPNITKPAFEICISRLYGGGPPLHVSPGLIPTLAYPLTPDYPIPSPKIPLPDRHHPASPRLLLSLVVTAVYLSLPTVASQALTGVLSSIGPSTVVRYLDFACGKGIGPADGDEPDAAIGLESLAQPIPDTTSQSSASIRSATPNILDTSEDEPDLDAFEKLDLHHKRSDLSLGGTRSERMYDYGNVSNKVGEACACWLARWCSDLLAIETQTLSTSASELRRSTIRPRRHTDVVGDRAAALGTANVPRIWSSGGLSTTWVCAVLSSDSLFVKGEKERYALAKKVFELRQSQGTLNAEDTQQWSQFFHQGIYYANIGMEDLMVIGSETSPSTGKPYVDLAILQAAHWNQSILKQRVTSRPQTASSPGSSPPPQAKDLGLAMTGDEIVRSNASKTSSGGAMKVLYRVPVDSSSRIGDSVVEASTMDQLFDIGSTGNTKATRNIASETTFFGLASDRLASQDLVATEGSIRWSPHPPLRFGVEFWDVGTLTEKARLHSHTVWYAGSLYNVYVQVIRKKGVQLGVYLHRQSTVEPIPHASIPRSMAPPPPGVTRTHSRGPSLPTPLLTMASPAISRPRTPMRGAIPGSPIGVSVLAGSTFDVNAAKVSGIASTATVSAPAQPYRDSRPAVSAHFTIQCHGATGSSLTRFTSAPDVFTVGQSWGWKSSSHTEEYFELSDDPHKAAATQKHISLRATVILGIV